MRRPVRIALVAVSIVVVALVLTLAATHRALTAVDPFYAKALDTNRETLVEEGRELESRAAALYNDTQYMDRWSSVISADQINGWLAVKLAEQHSDALPQSVRNPRVAIAPGALFFGFEVEKAGIELVVTIKLDAFLVDSQSLGFRLVSVHAGALPLPVKKLAEDFRSATNRLASLRWTRIDGDPVVIFDFAAQWPKDAGRVHLDTLELHEGEIYLAGHTLKDDGESVASFEEPAENPQPERQPSDQ